MGGVFMGTIKKLGLVLTIVAAFLSGFLLANEELSLMELQISMTRALQDGLNLNTAKLYVQELLELEQVDQALKIFREFVENLFE